MTITEPAPNATVASATVAARPLVHVNVLIDRCVGCQECIVRCPTEALSLDMRAMVAVADDELCVGCRQCERTCPFTAITVSGPVLVAPRIELPALQPENLSYSTTETRGSIGSWSDAMAESARCLACPDPTCVRGCPAHNDIPSFIAALRTQDLGAAHSVLRRTSVLPDVCSRVCDQAIQCEGACTWSLAGGRPVAIGALERFICDQAPVPEPSPPEDPGASRGPRVAIIGSGPAGLAAAWELVEGGAQVTVYDKDAVAGGLLHWGIPNFTLAADVAQRPVAALVGAGVEFCLGVDVGSDDLDRLVETHDAVLVAVGAGRPLVLPFPGADLDGVWDATRFLKEAGAARARGTGFPALRCDTGRDPTVLVLGAGNTAMDVARTARRLGARVVCIDWMDRKFAPVRPDELAEAESEGVTIRFNRTVECLESNGGTVRAARLSVTRQRHGGARPKVVARNVDGIEVDLVVMAMGYRLDGALGQRTGDLPIPKVVPALPDRRWLASGLLANRAPDFARGQPVGALALGRESARRAAGRERSDRVWVAGDALTGPATVVDAMAQGKEAGQSILAATAFAAASAAAATAATAASGVTRAP